MAVDLGHGIERALAAWQTGEMARTEIYRTRIRYANVCFVCGTDVPVGVQGWYDPVRKKIACGDHDLSASSVAEPPAADAAVDDEVRSPQLDATLASGPQPPDVAGASAKAEYEKRSARERRRQEQAVADDAAWREKVKTEHRLVGPVVAAFTPKPVVAETQSTTAWKTGAEGEERVAEVLADVAGIEVLHDRHWPGTRNANIDHIVVGPSGVFVIDAKKYQGKIELVDKGSWLKSDWRLYVNGRNETKRVDSMLSQADAVRGVLGNFADVPVSGVLCFIGADWGLFGPRKVKTLKGVTMLWPLKLPDYVSAAGAVDVATVAAHLRVTLKPAR